MLKRDSYKPLYKQLADYLRENITSGAWSIGSTVPSEIELTEQFQVSRNTVRGALKSLEQDGFIYRIHGKGTFVASNKLDQSLGHLTGFSEDARTLGLEPAYKNIEIRPMRADSKVSAKLKQAPNSEVLFIHRLQLANGRPYIVAKLYLPKRWYDLRGFDVAADLESGGSFYDLLEGKYGIRLGDSNITITASAAGAEISKLLECSEGAPVLTSERVTFTQESKEPLEYTLGYGHPDRHQWSTTLRRRYQ